MNVINAVKARIKPKKLLLFGSFARGDVHDGSDVDLLVVSDFKEKFFDRIGKVMNCNDSSFALDVLAYTPKEFNKMKKEKNALLARALKEGICF